MNLAALQEQEKVGVVGPEWEIQARAIYTVS